MGSRSVAGLLVAVVGILALGVGTGVRRAPAAHEPAPDAAPAVGSEPGSDAALGAAPESASEPIAEGAPAAASRAGQESRVRESGWPLGAGDTLAVDWTAGAGRSEEAVTDGGTGITRWCAWDRVLEVVEGGSVGYPHGRVLTIRSLDGCGHVEFENLFPAPRPGDVWGVRYDLAQEAGQTDTKMHPHTFWPVGAIEAVHMSIDAKGGGAWTPHPRFGWGASFPFGVLAYRGGEPLVVPPGAWITYEFELEWVSPTSYIPRMRLLDFEGELLTDDFRGTEWPFPPVGDAVATVRDPEHMRTPSFGMGQAGSSGRRYMVARARFWVR